MILLNNSFTIIVKAIEEGRRIIDNLKKIVAYLLSTSFSEMFLVGAALFAGTPLPLLPAQILWTNIIEEGFMNFSFAFEPKEDDVMKRNPSSTAMRNIVTPRLRSLVLILSIVTGATLVVIYFILLAFDIPIERIRTLLFVLLSFESIFFVFSIKDLSKPLWKINPFTNKYLVVALFLSIATVFLVLTVPALRTLLSLTPLSILDIGIIFAMGIFNVFLIELMKHLFFFDKK